MNDKESFRWGWMVVIVFLFQIGFIWVVSKNTKIERSFPAFEVTHVENLDILSQMMLEDSLSLARPARRGFSGAWLNPPTNKHKPVHWRLPDILLPEEADIFGEVMSEVLSKESNPEINIFQRPDPQLTRVAAPSLNYVNTSRLVVEGPLHSRFKVESLTLKSFWKVGTFLKPSRVQILVDQEGKVLSGVLLESSGHQPADQAAMKFALRKVAFERVTNKMLETGNLVFYWHIDPSSITNVFESAP